jgi:hypothetical protein
MGTAFSTVPSRMIDGGNDVAFRRQPAGEPHHLQARATGPVRNKHQRQAGALPRLCAARRKASREHRFV